MRLRQLAWCVCGDEDTFPYKRHVDLDVFFSDLSSAAEEFNDPGEAEASRPARSLEFVSACNRGPLGSSGMPHGIETLVERLLDIGEFASTADRAAAATDVAKVFDGYPVRLETSAASARLVGTRKSRGQQLIDERFETIFGDIVKDSELAVARLHFSKARRMLDAPEPDFENAVKEAVSSVESYLKTLTAEKDFKKAITKAVTAGVPRPVAALIEKLYAWRGDEPGVAHAATVLPNVAKAEADFACNQAMVINRYLGDVLAPESPETSAGA
jgi:hypothetical protein